MAAGGVQGDPCDSQRPCSLAVPLPQAHLTLQEQGADAGVTQDGWDLPLPSCCGKHRYVDAARASGGAAGEAG